MVDGKHLSKFICPKTHEGREIMNRIPCTSVIGSIIYSMICTHSDIRSPVHKMVLGEHRRRILESSKESLLVLEKY